MIVDSELGICQHTMDKRKKPWMNLETIGLQILFRLHSNDHIMLVWESLQKKNRGRTTATLIAFNANLTNTLDSTARAVQDVLNEQGLMCMDDFAGLMDDDIKDVRSQEEHSQAQMQQQQDNQQH